MDSEAIASVAVGLIALFALVIYRHQRERWQMRRLQQYWEEGESALREGRLQDAEKSLQRAVNAQGLWIPARQLLAQVHALQGKFEQAEKELQMAAALRPREPEGPFALALLYARHRPGQQAEALRYLQAAFTLSPRAKELLDQYRDQFRTLEQEPEFQALLK